MKIVLSNIIEIQDPTKEVLDYCKKELTFNNPDYIKKQRMGFWTGKTPKNISLYDKWNDKLYLPIGCFDDIWKLYPHKNDYTDYTSVKPRNIKSNIILRDYQKPCADALKKYVNGIFVMPTGFGKTQVGLECAAVLNQHTLWCTHTKDLLNQAKERCESNLECTTSEITEGKCDVSGDIVFATVQTLSTIIDKEEIKPDEFGLVIVDECFPKGTLINTPKGYAKIEDLKLGDMVYCYNHSTERVEIKPIDYLFHKTTNELVNINLLNGKKITCTKTHPIYTNRGYIQAKDLKQGDVVYEMCILREERYRKRLSKRKMVDYDCEIQKNRTNLLLPRLWKKMGSQKFNKFFTIRQMEKDYANKQSDVEKRNSRESIKNITRTSSQTTKAWWKWDRTNRATKTFANCFTKTQNKCSPRTSNKNSSKKRQWISNLLQSRYWNRRFKIGDRNRWHIALPFRKTKTRFKERYILKSVRVESVTFQEQRSFGRYKQSYGKNIVYNIGVKDNHNYFVKGILVHNCHHLATSAETVTMFEKCINYFNARYKLGISATLHRADGLEKTTTKLIGNVIYEIKKSDDKTKFIGYYENKPIIEVPLENFQAPAKIYMRKTSYNALNKDIYDTSGRIVFARLISDLTSDYDRNNQVLIEINNTYSPTLVISERTTQLEYLQKHTRNSIYINGKTPKKEREQMLEDFRNGKYRVLFATYSLVAEGLDIPRLTKLVMASPVKDERLVIQAIGRCQRPYEGKKNADIIDFVDDVSLLDKFTRKKKSTYKKEGWEIIY